MSTVSIIILVGIVITALGFGYYIDYKRDKTYFLSGLKGTLKGMLILTFAFLVSFVFVKIKKEIFPLKNDYGKEHNQFRENLNVPIIEEGWYEIESWGQQYRKWYSNLKKHSKIGHSKKRIEFDIWGADYEEDYFEGLSEKEILLTRYNYKTEELKYYHKYSPVNLDFEMEVQEEEITKTEFDKISSNWLK